MKNHITLTKKIKMFNCTKTLITQHLVKNLIAAAFAVCTLTSVSLTLADNVRLVDKPLVDSTPSDVLPNLMYILDNSGSMAWNYTPDWVSTFDNVVSVTNTIAHNEITYRNFNLTKNADFNTQYYNPSTRYTPGVNFDGISRGEQTTWTSVRNDNYNVQNNTNTLGQTGNSTNLVGSAEYFAFVAGEHCTTAALTNCIASNVATATHPFPATIRWCNSTGAAGTVLPAMPANNACRAVREGVFVNLRRPISTFTLTFSRVTLGLVAGGNGSINNIVINNMNMLSQPVGFTNTTNADTIATSVFNNMCRSGLNTNQTTGNCTIYGNTVTRNNNVLTITTTAGAPLDTNATLLSALLNPVTPVTVNITQSSLLFPVLTTTSPVVSRSPGSMVYTQIVNGRNYTEPGKLTAAPDRTDCGTTCTYAQEMTNYANWWTYYRTRMQGMKTSTSLAFKPIDNKFRIGFITINSPANNYLPINKFETGNGSQKANWYNRLFVTVPNGGTPLRESLGTVGRIFAGKKPVGNADPIEYACQANFALLTTDGYWNGNAGRDVNNALIGNLDGVGTPRPLFEGNTASGTLADVAKYYYDTDIRQSIGGFANCNGALGQNVCGDGVGNENIRKQNMTTLTLGLGIDGTLLFDPDYKNQAVGDFADIKSGAKDWPAPAQDQPSAIDDLWHAAVNSNGTYFSARNPRELSDSLRRALADIQSSVGAGAAAAVSSSQPTSGDNFEYVASYATVKWIGNLEARTIDLETFETSANATWCAEDIAASSCEAPAQLASENGTFFCRNANSNATACSTLGGSLVGTECRRTVPTACSGTLKSRVAQNSDNRTIYMNSGNSLVRFEFNNMNATQKAFYQAPFLSNNLSQWPNFTTGINGQQAKATGENLINYLRGQQGFEDRSSNLTIENRIFRAREATLGDITESQPAFVGKPAFNFLDAGYDAYKAAQASRSPTVYVGANDGMLHAFNATNGQERWAFVPTPAISKMWKLADKDYATNHVNLVNGDPVVTDFFDGSWKTILVAGLNGGGRGYYALDVTNPDAPKLLWEKTAQDINNLGYTFGSPIVTKLDGNWVVLITSGYNNGSKDNDGITNLSPQGNGGGYLYVLNASNGNLIRSYSTNVGSPTTPSGLSPVATYIDNLNKNNTSLFAIGGDLEGNVWKFDLSTNNPPIRLATLAGPSGPQPITAVPEIGLVNRAKVAFIGTGKYLEVADLTNYEKQSLYAIKVDGDTPLGNPRSQLVQQVITGGNNRTVTNNNVNFNTSLGWYVDFPELGERVNVDPLLAGGALLTPTIVPASTSCSPGGFGYLNFFNYKTGGLLIPGGVLSERTRSPIAGFNVLYTKDGDARVKATLSDSPTAVVLNTKISRASARTKLLKPSLSTCVGPNCKQGKEYNWRELLPPLN